ncbi:hypothetical protein D3C71_1100670 [compost metagenome]
MSQTSNLVQSGSIATFDFETLHVSIQTSFVFRHKTSHPNILQRALQFFYQVETHVKIDAYHDGVDLHLVYYLHVLP